MEKCITSRALEGTAYGNAYCYVTRPDHTSSGNTHHLGIKPGDKISLDLLPARIAALKSVERPDTIDSFIGGLSAKSRKKATLEEMSEAARAGWAGRP